MEEEVYRKDRLNFFLMAVRQNGVYDIVIYNKIRIFGFCLHFWHGIPKTLRISQLYE